MGLLSAASGVMPLICCSAAAVRIATAELRAPLSLGRRGEWEWEWEWDGWEWEWEWEWE